MADTRQLIAGLREYHAGLTSQLGLLEEEVRLLEGVRSALDSVFHGDAADEFRQRWQRTAERFRLYQDQGALLARGLQERIGALESFNADVGDLKG